MEALLTTLSEPFSDVRTLSVCLGIVVGVLTCTVAIRRKKERYDLDRMPGPPRQSWLFGSLFQVCVPHQHWVLLDWTREYGGLFKLDVMGTDMVVLSDPEVIQSVIAHGHSLPKHADTYRGYEKTFGGDNLLSHIYHTTDAYKSARKTVAMAFSNEALKKQLEVMKEKTLKLLAHLSRAGPEQAVEVDDCLLRLTMDVMGATAFKTEFHALDFGPTPYLEAVGDAFRDVSRKELDPWYRLQADLYPLTSVSRRVSRTKAELNKLESALCRHLMSLGVEEDDHSIGAQLKRLVDVESGRPMSFEQLLPHLILVFNAGFETTSHTIAWTLFELACHPQVQEEVRRELEGLGLLQTPARPAPPLLEYTQLRDLTYLNAALKEAMRMHAVAAAGTARETVAPFQLGPYTIPAGVLLWVQLHSLHNSPHNYIKPDLFLPERWIPGAALPDIEPDPRYPEATWTGNSRCQAKSFAPFSDGPRACVGLNMGLMQARLVVASILSRFTISLAPEAGSRQQVLKEQVNMITLQPSRGVHLRFQPHVE